MATTNKLYGGIEQDRIFEKGKKNIVKRMIWIVANMSSKVVFFFSILAYLYRKHLSMLVRNTHSQK